MVPIASADRRMCNCLQETGTKTDVGHLSRCVLKPVLLIFTLKQNCVYPQSHYPLSRNMKKFHAWNRHIRRYINQNLLHCNNDALKLKLLFVLLNYNLKQINLPKIATLGFSCKFKNIIFFSITYVNLLWWFIRSVQFRFTICNA